MTKPATTVRVKARPPEEPPSPTVMTIGHSARTIEELIGLLEAHGSNVCRGCAHGTAFPAQSAVQPRFAAPVPEESRSGVCSHAGTRRPAPCSRPDSVNLGWRNASFRGYADYMQTPEFTQSVEALIRLASQERIVLMCRKQYPGAAIVR